MHFVYGLSFDKAAFSRNARHNNVNMIIQKALSCQPIMQPSLNQKAFSIWIQKDLMAWQLFLTKKVNPSKWDFTCVDTVADSYFHKSSLEAGKTADMAEKKKIHKYRHLANDFDFIPIWNRD